ncbi:MAG TPA: hypothetical protein VJ183_02040 [Chloroflexia bacterium]|nr:hypothetical protein [Chloroflexia bacterium]
MEEKKSESRVEEIDGERSEEEVAWDKEFKDDKGSGFASAIGDMVKLAIKVPVVILQMPLSLVPEETARHTRAAFRETFLAFRSLLGAIGDGIENILAEPDKSVPDGTWGTGPGPAAPTKSETASSGGKMKRIQLSDEDGAESSEDATMTMPDETEEEDTGEGRGLRADIEY